MCCFFLLGVRGPILRTATCDLSFFFPRMLNSKIESGDWLQRDRRMTVLMAMREIADSKATDEELLGFLDRYACWEALWCL